MTLTCMFNMFLKQKLKKVINSPSTFFLIIFIYTVYVYIDIRICNTFFFFYILRFKLISIPYK